MMAQIKIEHIGIAVNDIDKYIKIFEELGGELIYREQATNYDTECAFIKFANTEIELIKGLKPDSPPTKFIEKYGEGLHHIAISGTNIKGKFNGAKPDMKVKFNIPDENNRILTEEVSYARINILDKIRCGYIKAFGYLFPRTKHKNW